MAEDHGTDPEAHASDATDDGRLARLERKLASVMAEQALLETRLDNTAARLDGAAPATASREVTSSLRTVVDFIGAAQQADNDVQAHLVAIDDSVRALTTKVAEATDAVNAESPLAGPVHQVVAEVEQISTTLGGLETSVPAALSELTARRPLSRADVDQALVEGLAELNARTERIEADLRSFGSRLTALYDDMTGALKRQEDQLGQLVAKLRMPVELNEIELAVARIVAPLNDQLHLTGQALTDINRRLRGAELRATAHADGTPLAVGPVDNGAIDLSDGAGDSNADLAIDGEPADA